MDFRERLRWLAHQAFLLFVLLAVAFLSAVLTMRFAILGREVEMPPLVGMKAGDAQALLASRQLGFRIVDRSYSQLPKDSVVRQYPPPGTKVKKGQRAHVVVSLGPQQVTIPTLEGRTLRAARIELLRSGLQVGEISNLFTEDYDPGLILQQFPPAEARNAGSPRVNLLVSAGPREPAYVMPDLTGLSVTDAQRRLFLADLRVIKIVPTPSAYAPRGSVIAHLPPRGARVTPNTPIELHVVE